MDSRIDRAFEVHITLPKLVQTAIGRVVSDPKILCKRNRCDSSSLIEHRPKRPNIAGRDVFCDHIRLDSAGAEGKGNQRGKHGHGSIFAHPTR